LPKNALYCNFVRAGQTAYRNFDEDSDSDDSDGATSTTKRKRSGEGGSDERKAKKAKKAAKKAKKEAQAFTCKACTSLYIDGSGGAASGSRSGKRNYGFCSVQ